MSWDTRKGAGGRGGQTGGRSSLLDLSTSPDRLGRAYPNLAMRLPLPVAVLPSLLLMFLAACSSAPAAPPGPARPTTKTPIACSVSSGGPAFTAVFIPGNRSTKVDSLQVVFLARPTSAQAETALRACVESMRSAVRVDYETLVNGWVGDQGPLTLPDGSDSLAYDPKASTVKTGNERQGLSSTTAQRDGYTVSTTNEKTLVPPFTPYVTLHVLFEKARSAADVEKILLTEVEAIARQRTPRVDVLGSASAPCPYSDCQRIAKVGGASKMLSIAPRHAR